ncbi:MAG: NifB/NifX family molybdenum-iron cluster-binding protein [Mailhella sp.]|nr:NifB/NifX family molybdenum-iron cluster-binding protein [Mailhella sp.]
MQKILVAIPSDAPGGLDAAPSAHFGHCDAYTVVTVEDGKMTDSFIEYNEGHGPGGCVEPVRALAEKGVSVLIAGGMGMRPLSIMQQLGITVMFSSGYATVRDTLQAYLAGKLSAFDSGNLCNGGCGHHQAAPLA